MPEPSANHRTFSLPWLPATLLRAWVPCAEREEVLEDLGAEYAARREKRGRLVAGLWLWRQTLGSLPALLRRSWWRGWTGFEPNANRMRPGGSSMESWIMDMRYAARRLRSRPTYALLAILTVALGVGGTAAIYSIVRELLIGPLPYADEGNVVAFWSPFDWSEQELVFLRPHVPAFKQIAGFRPADVTLELGTAPAQLLHGIASSSELFSVLGAAPALGRTFRPGEDVKGAEAVAVLSHAMWRKLGSDPSIVGRRLRMGGLDRTVIGVMPPKFWFPNPSVEVWVPAEINPEASSGNYAVIGRLAANQRLEAMAAPLAQMTRALGERFKYPDGPWDRTKNAKLTPVREYLIGSLRPALLATSAAMALILLIACANVAALMLGQVNGRSAELAVRSALGADRRRLTQQLIAEALLIGLLAGLAGAGLAAGGFRVLVASLPLGAWAVTATLDWWLFVTAIGIALVAALGIAMVPTVSLWRGGLPGALTRMRTTRAGGTSARMEGGLVVAEVALAVLMAAGAALLIRSVTTLYAIDPGVSTDGVAVVDVMAPTQSTYDARKQMLRGMMAELATIPGVQSVSAVQRLPLRGGGDNWGIRVEGKPDLPATTTYFRIVQPGYFETMGIRVLSGRTFTPADRAESEPVVVINDALAKQYFPGENPIGRRLITFRDPERIVGVVGNVSEGSLTDSVGAARYVLYDQIPYAPEGNTLVLAVDRSSDAAGVLNSARHAVERVAPGVAVQNLTTMERVFTAAVGPARQIMTLLSLLTVIAMVLGAVGVYGVISDYVNRRKRDWGIRISLGQTPSGVIRQVVGRGTALVAGGAALGLVGAAVSTRLLGSLLYGVGAGDPLALAAATGALLAVGVLAAYVPAYRASRVDPAIVLREQ